jgi:hypothetical protein
MDIKVLCAYMRSYAVSAINDPNIDVDEIADKVLQLSESSDKTISGSDLNGMICDITRTNKTERCMGLIDSLIRKRPELEKSLFSLQAVLMTRTCSVQELINKVTNYEEKFGRDEDSLSALLNAYMIDGYEKREADVQDLLSQLQRKVGI